MMILVQTPRPSSDSITTRNDTILWTTFKGVRIDYRQDDTFYCVPDDSFYGRGWKTLFEHDESIRSLPLMRIALRNPDKHVCGRWPIIEPPYHIDL